MAYKIQYNGLTITCDTAEELETALARLSNEPTKKPYAFIGIGRALPRYLHDHSYPQTTSQIALGLEKGGFSSSSGYRGIAEAVRKWMRRNGAQMRYHKKGKLWIRQI